jgi:integrase
MRNIGNMKALQPENIHMTLEEEMSVRDYICKESVAKRERAIVALLLSTGIRVGELVSMNRSDVNLLDGSITFRGEKSDRIRTVFLDVRAKRYLQEYLLTRSDTCPALFVTERKYNGLPKRLCKTRYESITKEICRAAGVAGKECTVHVFRRTFATRLADQGAPLEVIQELLGHANADTTSRCYIARSTKRIRDKVSQYMIVA